MKVVNTKVDPLPQILPQVNSRLDENECNLKNPRTPMQWPSKDTYVTI